MAFALPKPIQDMIPEKYDTLWCDGYHTYFHSSGCRHIQETLYEGDYPDFIPLFKVDKPFKVPKQDDIQQIYKEIKGLSFDCCYKQFKRWDAFRYQFEEFEHNFDSFNFFITGSWTVLWLCFLMETVFNQTWDGNTWQVIE